MPSCGSVQNEEECKQDNDLQRAQKEHENSLKIVLALIIRRTGRGIRKVASTIISALGFVWSVLVDICTGRKKKKWDAVAQKLDEFLKESGIDVEISSGLTKHILTNLRLLARVRMVLHPGDLRKEAVLQGDELGDRPNIKYAYRYMRFATAVYGPAFIDAAKVEAEEDVYDPLDLQRAVLKICEHTGVPENDVLVNNVDYGGCMDCLRHLVAVDHDSKAVVLAIRGTMSLSGVMIDIAGYTEEFCGGEAHSGIAKMARAVWDKANADLSENIDRVPDDYDVVITGHSLGAGVACLVTIMCQYENLLPGRSVRCLAYAPPPVFSPLSAAKKAVQCTTAYINENDCVPFLSVDALRRLFVILSGVDEERKHAGWLANKKVIYGLTKPSERMINKVKFDEEKEMQSKKGGAPLAIPASSVVWMKEDENENETAISCDPLLVAKLGIHVEPGMTTSHYPFKYERALKSLPTPSLYAIC